MISSRSAVDLVDDDARRLDKFVGAFIAAGAAYVSEAGYRQERHAGLNPSDHLVGGAGIFLFDPGKNGIEVGDRGRIECEPHRSRVRKRSKTSSNGMRLGFASARLRRTVASCSSVR